MKPIIFTGESIPAILEGRKTMTRRVLRDQPLCSAERWIEIGGPQNAKLPYQVGDLLWVRETWDWNEEFGSKSRDCPYLFYQANQIQPEPRNSPKWRPSIFMPRWASRITLKVTTVKVERVQEISEDDTCSEGVSWESWAVENDMGDWPAINAFRALWDSLNAKRGHGWDQNDWVGAYTFEVQP